MQIVLVHGGWQGGWAWDGVADELRRMGHEVIAPTLRGLEDGDVDRSGVTMSMMARDLIDQVRELTQLDIVLVGHSGGGPLIQLVAEAMPERIGRVVFVDAWVLRDGETINDVLPDPLVAAVKALASQSDDNTVVMPPELWAASFMQDATPEQLAAVEPRLVPTPAGWFYEPIRLDRFWASSIPSSYVFLAQDQAVPAEIYQAAAGRLDSPRTIEIDGSHMVMLTHPERLARALDAVIAYPDDVAPISYTELAPSGAPARWIVLVHGGGASNEYYLETPDGRQGWAARFVSHGYGVLVVDWLGLSYEAAQHVDDRAASARLDYESVCRGMGVFLSGLGRNVVLVVHSMAGPIGFRLLETHGDLIDGLVAVAPGPPGNIQAVPEIVRESDQEVSIRGAAIDWTIPKMGFWEPTSAFVNDKAIGPSRRFPRECIEVFRRTLRPIPARMLYQRQNIGGSQMRIGPTDAFTNKPILVFTGGADTDHPSQLDQDIVAWLTDQGAAVTFWSSELPLLAGNGHSLMVEDNSDEIADEIARWITAL